VKYPLIAYLDLYSSVLPVTAGLYRWNQLKTNRFGAAFVFALTSIGAIAELGTYWMAINGLHTVWVLHFYHLAEFILLMCVFSFWKLGVKNEDGGGGDAFFQSSRFFRWSVALYSVFWLVSKWTFEPWDQPANYTLNISTFVFILISLFTLYRLVSQKSKLQDSILRNFQFWITAGVLIYFAGSALDFLFASQIFKLPPEYAMSLWTIHWSINVLANILYAYGFVCLIPPRIV
jgi:hypothetical protein